MDLLITSKLALSWCDLSVRGLGNSEDVVFHTDMGSILAPWTTTKAKKAAAARVKAKSVTESGHQPDHMSWNDQMARPGKGEPGLRPGERYLLKDFSGLLRPGEMMLVVGRPGSGCSTFLKTLAGLTGAYAGVDGDVLYGDTPANSKAFKPFSSLVCYSSEEDDHDPNLTVGRTLDFATRNLLVSPSARPIRRDGRASSDEEYRVENKTSLLRTFAIEHTHDTKVGNQYVRGVSGEYRHVQADHRWRTSKGLTRRGARGKRIHILLGQRHTRSRRQHGS
jgi:energy-coupling factor transporter ATP-binding protein EcfA2